jgi:hypothetical protein
VQVKREAVGIDKVIVNGTVLLENGELTGALPGQIIRGPLYQAKAVSRWPRSLGHRFHCAGVAKPARVP